MTEELLKAYEGIMLRFLRGKITREERNAQIIALRDTPAAAGLSFKERNALADEAVVRVAEVHGNELTRWEHFLSQPRVSTGGQQQG